MEEEIGILATTKAQALLKNPQEYTVVGNCFGCSNDIELFRDFIEWYNSNNIYYKGEKKSYEDRFFPVIQTLSYYFKDNICSSKNNFYNPSDRGNLRLTQGMVNPIYKSYGIFVFSSEFKFKNFDEGDMKTEIGKEVFNKPADELTLTFTICTSSGFEFNKDLKIGIFKKNPIKPILTLESSCHVGNTDAQIIYRQSQGRDWWRARSVREGVRSAVGSVRSAVGSVGSAVGSVGSAVVGVGSAVRPHIEQLLDPREESYPSPPPHSSFPPPPPPSTTEINAKKNENTEITIDDFFKIFSNNKDHSFLIDFNSEKIKVTDIKERPELFGGSYTIYYRDTKNNQYKNFTVAPGYKIKYTLNMQGGKPLTKRHRKKRQNKKRKSRKSKK